MKNRTTTPAALTAYTAAVAEMQAAKNDRERAESRRDWTRAAAANRRLTAAAKRAADIGAALAERGTDRDTLTAAARLGFLGKLFAR